MNSLRECQLFCMKLFHVDSLRNDYVRGAVVNVKDKAETAESRSSRVWQSVNKRLIMDALLPSKQLVYLNFLKLSSCFP